ncbi:MAG TPA: hypothetical protein VM638_07010 [Actinomycetota bacterium]|nr:hypothetical protein [Actinomycetota bacterium]
MTRITEVPLMAALAALGLASLLFAWRSFVLLYRDIRPKYRGSHRRRRSRA